MIRQIEQAGLDEKEMKILKEEFDHHQQKVDQYYALVDNLHERRDKTSEQENSIEHFLEDEVVKGEHDDKGKKKKARGKDSEYDFKTQHVETVCSSFILFNHLLSVYVYLIVPMTTYICCTGWSHHFCRELLA